MGSNAASAVVAWGYMVGTALLIPATVLMLDAFAAYYGAAIWILVVATSFLTLAALVAFVDGCRPCPCRRRRRPHGISASATGEGGGGTAGAHAAPLLAVVAADGSGRVDADAAAPPQGGEGTAATATAPPGFPRFWGLLNLWLMEQGGILFLAASCMYLPGLSNQTVPVRDGSTTLANLGTWVFRAGTACYLWGSTISMVQIAYAPGGCRGALRVTCGVLLYTVGAVFYFVGGALSQLGLPGFAATWIVGSVLFASGSVAFLMPDVGRCKPNRSNAKSVDGAPGT